MKVYKCINEVQSALSKVGISKDQKNEMQKWKFRGIDDVYNALAPLLAEYGLCMLPKVLSRNLVERTTQKGGLLFYVTLEIEYTLVAVEDGSSHTIIVVGEAMDSSDKATNKAMSAAYKYACIQTFCIPIEGEADADQTTVDDIKPLAKPAPQVSMETFARVNDLIEGYGLTHLIPEWLEYFKVKSLSTLSEMQAKQLINRLVAKYKGTSEGEFSATATQTIVKTRAQEMADSL